jgi:hypothetical protein
MFTKRLENNFLQKLNLATKALRHKGAKTQRKNAKHFFYFVPLSLSGKLHFSQRSCGKIFLNVIRKELKKLFMSASA